MNNLIENTIKKISNDFIFDLYLPVVNVLKNESPNKKYIDNTIKLYCKNNTQINEHFFNELKDVFVQIIDHDIVIKFENNLILQELYKILHLIDNTNQTLDFISQKAYPKRYFASYHSDRRELLREAKKHRKIVLNYKSPILDKGEHRLNYSFNKSLANNPKIVKYFLHLFTILDINRICLFNGEEKQYQEKFLLFLESKLVQKTTEKDILKSLAILIHTELKLFLKLKDYESKEFTTEILQILFRFKPNDEEFNKTIYFRSSIKYFPIFGATRNDYFNEDEKNTLKEILSSEISIDSNNMQFEQLFDVHLQTPHIQFLMKYPVEFFRKNPKYSTI